LVGVVLMVILSFVLNVYFGQHRTLKGWCRVYCVFTCCCSDDKVDDKIDEEEEESISVKVANNQVIGSERNVGN